MNANPTKPTAFALAAAALLAAGPSAAAADGRVAVLAPSGSPTAPLLERNVRSMTLSPVPATVAGCTRDVVTRLLDELDAGSALCADGDAIAVWTREGRRARLHEVVVTNGASDERVLEVAAARAAVKLLAAIAAQGPAADPAGGVTIVANGGGAAVEIVPTATPPAPAPADAVTPTLAPLARAHRSAPTLVVGVGPGVVASRDGTSLAISAVAEIAFSRSVALVPWLSFVPVNRDVERPEGTASFRPTLFGLGFSLPLRPPESRFVPRFGGGYAMLWMHVAGESATAPATTRSPEDLLAPVIYATAALSVGVSGPFRIAAEAFGGVSSHDMVVRIARNEAAHWGVPLGALTLRGEWVLR